MDWSKIQYFKPQEFACPHCGQTDMDYDFMLQLDEARSIADIPFRINSGFRCAIHNREVGGAAHSPHLTGQAADIALYGAPVMEVIPWFTGIGLKQHGDIDRRYIHVDTAPQIDGIRPRPWIWTYS